MVSTINSSNVVSLFVPAFHERKERKQMWRNVTWLRFGGRPEVVVEGEGGKVGAGGRKECEAEMASWPLPEDVKCKPPLPNLE